MARFEPDSVVTQSVLDRLIDNEPGNSSEASMTRAQSVRALKASLRRDLEWLLNTRRIPEEADDHYPELKKSLYNYGFPDFTNFSFSSPRDRIRLVKVLEEAVRTFEPRMEAARVVLIDADPTGQEINRSVRFQIEGLLRMDPAPEQVCFDTVLSLTSGEYKVKGDKS
jgi:type VI secretion system protein ImpF